MKSYSRYLLALIIGLAAAGCYNKFDEVPPMVNYDTEEAFREAFPDCEYKTIKELKAVYAARTNDPSYEGGENSSWSDTKYYRFEEDYYLRAKVISNDEEGNVYKSLYLLDETGAIEVRLGLGNYLSYPMGEYDPAVSPIEIPSTYVYVRVKDLYIGNYRMMLSIGAGPTDSFNKRDEHKFYANSAIDDPRIIADHVFVGEPTTLVEGADIPVIDQSNYSSLNGQNAIDMLGRLILFKDISCMYAGVADQRGVTLSGIGDNIFPSWLYTENMQYANGILTKPWYNWAYSVDGDCLYGSVLFTYLSTPPSSGMNAGVFSLRTSGYSRFASRQALKSGAKGNLLALYSIYSKSWTYTYGAYQLSVSRYQDIMFDRDAYLSAEQVVALTPDGNNGTYRFTDPAGENMLAFDTETNAVVIIGVEQAREASVVSPTFFTRYTDEADEFDSFVNYAAFAQLPSAVVFKVESVNSSNIVTSTEYFVVKSNGDAVSAVGVSVSDNAFAYNEAVEFEVAGAGEHLYTLRHGEKYLAIADGALALSAEPYVWNISIPANEYDKEKDSYYVSWVGEGDDERGSND